MIRNKGWERAEGWTSWPQMSFPSLTPMILWPPILCCEQEWKVNRHGNVLKGPGSLLLSFNGLYMYFLRCLRALSSFHSCHLSQQSELMSNTKKEEKRKNVQAINCRLKRGRQRGPLGGPFFQGGRCGQSEDEELTQGWDEAANPPTRGQFFFQIVSFSV